MDKLVVVLIDAENTSVEYLDSFFKKIGQLGNAIVKRAYGNWVGGLWQKWTPALVKYCLTPILCQNSVKWKNSADIKLTIDAMDLLYSRLYTL